MLNGKRIVVVFPAYKAALTLERTYKEIPFDIVDEVVLVDDKSPDNTVDEARRLGIKHIVVHEQNKVLINQKLSEYHTGYRAFSAEVIRSIDFTHNSDDFVFDNEMISQVFMNGYEIAEVTCPTKYFEEASSINFSRSMKYGLGVLRVSLTHRLHKWGIVKSKLYGRPA